MSVSNPLSKQIYNGDGSTTVWTYTFDIAAGLAGSDVVVIIVDSDGNLTFLPATGGNYSNDTVNKQITYPVTGGISPLDPSVNALPSGWQIIICRLEHITQAVSLVTQGPFSAQTIMSMFDYLTLICQQLQEQLDRCLKYPINVVPSSDQLDPTLLTVSITPLISNATFPQLAAQAAAAPTTQFLCFATDLGPNGTFGFYTGIATAGPNSDGFIWVGGA